MSYEKWYGFGYQARSGHALVSTWVLLARRPDVVQRVNGDPDWARISAPRRWAPTGRACQETLAPTSEVQEGTASTTPSASLRGWAIKNIWDPTRQHIGLLFLAAGAARGSGQSRPQ